MTTGKQQMAEQSNSSDDLIAELSRLMAQDAHGNRQDTAASRDNAPRQDTGPRLASVATPPAEQASPFAVRIPGASAPQPANAAPPPARFDFGRAPVPVTSIPRQEPSLASISSPEPTSAPVNTDEPAPFNFDFNFGNQQPEPQLAVPPAAAPAASVASSAATAAW